MHLEMHSFLNAMMWKPQSHLKKKKKKEENKEERSRVHRDFSRFSGCFDIGWLYGLWCTWWDIFEVSTMLNWWTSAHLYSWETVSQRPPLLKPSHITVQMPISIFNCKMFLLSTTLISKPFVALHPNFFAPRCCQIQNELIFPLKLRSLFSVIYSE